MTAVRYTMNFDEIRLADISRVGGKNASLGELYNALRPLGVGALDGFATTADGYHLFLDQGGLSGKLRAIFDGLDAEDVEALAARGLRAREAVLETPLPECLRAA